MDHQSDEDGSAYKTCYMYLIPYMLMCVGILKVNRGEEGENPLNR